MKLSIRKMMENECLRVASIFGADELANRVLIIDTRYKDEFTDSVFECLGRSIPVEYGLLEHKAASLQPA